MEQGKNCDDKEISRIRGIQQHKAEIRQNMTERPADAGRFLWLKVCRRQNIIVYKNPESGGCIFNYVY